MKRFPAILLALNLLAILIIGLFVAIPRSIELEGTVEKIYSFEYSDKGTMHDVVIGDLSLSRGPYFHTMPNGVLFTVKTTDYSKSDIAKISCLVWGFDELFVPDCNLIEE